MDHATRGMDHAMQASQGGGPPLRLGGFLVEILTRRLMTYVLLTRVSSNRSLSS